MRMPNLPKGATRVLSVRMVPVAVSGNKPRAHDVQPLRFEVITGHDRRRGFVGNCDLVVLGASNCLPFAMGSFDAVLLLDVLEYVVDEESLLDEAVRVLRPGGTLVIRVPHAGPTTWLDSMNVYRYFADVTHRARTLPETYAVGWRRHYHRWEIERMLTGRGLCWTKTSTTGLGFAEPVNLSLMLLSRWLLRRECLYQRTLPVSRHLAHLDRLLPLGSFGFHLTAVAKRDESAELCDSPIAP